MENKQREITFRAWDKVKKYWVKPAFGGNICIGGDCIVIVDFRATAGVYVAENPKMLTWNEADNLEVNQFTGTHDKDGIRIFEGDIVRVTDVLPGHEQSKFIGWVSFKDGSFVIQAEAFTQYRWIDYEVEVIGNIYENSELLIPKEVEG